MDRNYIKSTDASGMPQSPPARVAWIETFAVSVFPLGFSVATREGGVDRNHLASHRQHSYLAVATREGGVDRNYLDEESAEAYGVATREGGVDRNWTP